ncbi:MAG: adenylate/guanylate cyclase domain-containing protein [Deltaproteobacteria bacterium]|nr:adenylate/guanylate cyclase domain-containing protein [Deltaproteobacteria bacterium]
MNKFNPIWDGIVTYNWRFLLQFVPGLAVVLCAVGLSRAGYIIDESQDFEVAVIEDQNVQLNIDDIGKLSNKAWVKSNSLASIRPSMRATTMWVRTSSQNVANAQETLVASVNSDDGVTMDIFTAEGSGYKHVAGEIQWAMDPREIVAKKMMVYFRVSIPPVTRPIFTILTATQAKITDKHRDNWMILLSGGIFMVSLISALSAFVTKKTPFLVVAVYGFVSICLLLARIKFIDSLGLVLNLPRDSMHRLNMLLGWVSYVLPAIYIAGSIDSRDKLKNVCMNTTFVILASNTLLIMTLAPGYREFAHSLGLGFFWAILFFILLRHQFSNADEDRISGVFGLMFADLIVVGDNLGAFEIGRTTAMYHELGVFMIGANIFSSISSNLLTVKKMSQSFQDSIVGRDSESDSVNQGGAKVDVTIVCIEMYDAAEEQETSRSEDVHLVKVATRMSSLVRLIKARGGNIDRCFGNGLICFFTNDDPHHSIMALNAMCAIREEVVNERVSAEQNGHDSDLMALKIGIHTGSVLMGNIAVRGKIDYTLVGHDVVRASQIANACQPFRILVSTQSRDLLVARGERTTRFEEFKIRLVDENDLFSSFEYLERNELNQDIIKSTKNLLSRESRKESDVREDRFQPSKHSNYTLQSEHGMFQVEDFASSGFRASSDIFLAPGVLIEMRLITNNNDVNTMLADKYIDSMTVEVRWSHSIGNGFQHGFKIIGDSYAQRQHRLAVLSIHNTAVQVA